MIEREMIVLDIDYITEGEKPVIRLFGREPGENPKRIIAFDNSFEPYFYIEPNDINQCLKDLEKYDTQNIEIVDKKDFQVPKKFIKITFTHPQEVPKYRDEIRNLDSVVDIREHDIPFYRRYLIDNDIVPMSLISVKGDIIESHDSISNNYDNLEIINLSDVPKSLNESISDFRILAFDLEVYNPRGLPNSDIDEIIMIGLNSNFGIRKVLSTKTKINDNDSFVEKFNSEKEMIEEFVKIIKDNQIDIIVGYNSDNFDFPYLNDRAKLYGIDLDLSMDGSSIKFIKRGFADAASFKGLLHIDLYLVMRRYMTLDRYTLERVYYELFGEEKKDVPGEIIWKYWDSDNEYLDELFDYSLDDVVSTLMISQQTLPLNLELTRIVGQPFFDITRMTTGQQAEWYLVKRAYAINEIIPNKPSAGDKSRVHDKNEGGFVKEPEPGLHENLVQFDFRSLYPSIIISKNICPDVLVTDGGNPLDNTDDAFPDEERYYVCPQHKHKFLKSPKGFIPSVIGDILRERLKIKKQMKKSTNSTEKKVLNIQQLAIKRLINTMYGVYGYSRFRWYSFECAQAITAWGREYILYTIETAKKYGFYAIYADTDGFYAEYRGNKKE